jgi:hypothetical protein
MLAQIPAELFPLTAGVAKEMGALGAMLAGLR